jgi:hypothetical protein
LLRDTLGDQRRLLSAGALGSAQAHLELRIVVGRDEARRQALRQRHARAERNAASEHDHPASLECPLQDFHVEPLDRPVEDLHDAVHAAWAVFAQHPRAQHRCEREAHEQRHADSERHRVAEVLEKTPGDAADERDRNEDRH